MEDDPCLRRVGESVVHFSAYQPQYELKDQYCTDIPKKATPSWSWTSWTRRCVMSRSGCG